MTLPFLKMKRHQARKDNPMQRPGALPLLVVTIQIQNRIESHGQIQVQSQGSNSKPEKSLKSQMLSKLKPRTQVKIPNQNPNPEFNSKSKVKPFSILKIGFSLKSIS